MHVLHPKSTRKVVLKLYMRDSVYLIYSLATGVMVKWAAHTHREALAPEPVHGICLPRVSEVGN